MTFEPSPIAKARARVVYQELFGKPKQEYTSYIRLFATDMEGTVFEKIPKTVDRNVVAPSLWALLMYDLGEEAFALEGILQDEWFAQNMKQYGRFVRRTVDVMQHYGLKKDDYLNSINSTDYMPGVHKAFQEIKDMGIYTGMITGGFQDQADRAQRDLGIGSVSAACKFYWNNDGTINHCNSLPWDDTEKYHFIESMMKELDARPSEIAYIGDSMNDFAILSKVGLPILINGKPEDEKTVKELDLEKKVKEMEHGVVVSSWSEVPAIILNYPQKHIY